MTRFVLLILVSLCAAIPQTRAADTATASHAWIDSGPGSVFVPIRTVQQCRMLTGQAALIEGNSKAHCYDSDKLLKEIRCQKQKKNKAINVTCESSDVPAD